MAVSSLMRRIFSKGNASLSAKDDVPSDHSGEPNTSPTLSQAELAFLFRAELRNRLALDADARIAPLRKAAEKQNVSRGANL